MDSILVHSGVAIRGIVLVNKRIITSIRRYCPRCFKKEKIKETSEAPTLLSPIFSGTLGHDCFDGALMF